MKRNIRQYLLVLALIIGGVFRLWQFGAVPPSPNWDEVALGYNAYSILNTGRDEYGQWFPRTLRSYDDYKPPLYMYTVVPFVGLFGLNTVATRMPSAIAGMLAIVGMYMLTSSMQKEHMKKKTPTLLPAIVALLFALSPWNIQFSRIAFEANVALTLTIWGVVFFYKGLRSQKWMSLSAVFFGLSLYAYHSQRIFTPLLVLSLALVYRSTVFRYRKKLIIAICAGLVVIAPLILEFANPATLTRLRGTSSLADQTALLQNSVEKLIIDQQNGNILGVILDNRRIVWIKTLIAGYMSHFSLRWIFVTGDNARHHAPDFGLMYIVELPFLLWGLYSIAVRKYLSRKLVYLWILIAPIAASPTTELPHAIRTMVLLPMLVLATGAGVYDIFRRLQKVSVFRRSLIYAGITLAVVLNVVHYASLYFSHTNSQYSQFWQYGYEQAVQYAQEHKSEYDKIVVSIKLEQPHMFFLFFTKYPPAQYLADGGTASGGFEEVRNAFDVYEFREIQWAEENRDGSTLYIASPKEIPPSEGIHTISYLNSQPAFVFAR